MATTESSDSTRGDDRLRPSGLLAAGTLCHRELTRFFRQRNRVFGAIGQPIVFWILFGAGLGGSFQMASAADVSYREYYFPGTLVLIVLFTAIFATISIIEDRREGFLQSVLVAPCPRWSMVLGKIAGGASIAMLQSLVFLALIVTLDIDVRALQLLSVVGLLAVLAVALNALGFTIAWRMDSTQGYHAVMSVFLLPMWLLSGAFFPVPAPTPESGWIEVALHWIMRLNPLTYGVAGLRHLMYIGSSSNHLPSETPALTTCLAVTALFTVCMIGFAWYVARRPADGDLL